MKKMIGNILMVLLFTITLTACEDTGDLKYYANEDWKKILLVQNSIDGLLEIQYERGITTDLDALDTIRKDLVLEYQELLVHLSNLEAPNKELEEMQLQYADALNSKVVALRQLKLGTRNNNTELNRQVLDADLKMRTTWANIKKELITEYNVDFKWDDTFLLES